MKKKLIFIFIFCLKTFITNCEIRIINGNPKELQILEKSFLKLFAHTQLYWRNKLNLEKLIKPNRKFIAKLHYFMSDKIEYYIFENHADVFNLQELLVDCGHYEEDQHQLQCYKKCIVHITWYYLDVKISVPKDAI